MTTEGNGSGVRRQVDPTANIASTVEVRGRGCLEVGAYAVIEDRAVIDLGTSGTGLLRLGPRSKIKVGVVIRCYNGLIAIGHHTSIGDYCVLHGHGGISIGADVGVGPHCTLAASQHIAEPTSTPIRYQGETARGIVVEDNVWIGAGSQILDGVTVGSGGVIGAGSVATRSTPRDHICFGVPCRPHRPR